MNTPRRVTQTDIAERAGVHVTTVSMALRNSPLIAVATKLRIQALAKELGYQRDPMLDALSSYRATVRPRAFQSVIAWLDGYRVPSAFGPNGIYAPLTQAARERAAALGFQMEVIPFDVQHPASVARMLVARGIEGVLVPPMPGGHIEVSLPWERFAAVSLSQGIAKPRLHLFMHDQIANIQITLRVLAGRGRRRPGLILEQHEHERTNGERYAGYLIHQAGLPESARVPPLIVKERSPENVRAYWIRHKPDALIVNRVGSVPKWLATLPGIGDTPEWVVAATVDPGLPGKGLREDMASLSNHAVEFLAGLIHRREKGPPICPVRILVKGRWRDEL
ncbi:LacI family transcriptional regulator [Opitutaceae bacterium TAV4]|uniref:LacI family DNA-binding transcriptional regulator n=1 Tax=Geminisphaera colitermitum TaxID=1148786 RepID=UPI000158D608|nr:LacI family DNA-binding transcriptional regulator [Geminisphaera colitermitum]RRJ96109.1 LacI family transcriptional regulator [Opitutaceae bacterium TAV4]RRK00243.1 LacI family transcriptional regulator [Opitutaceae bacterium TAV3]